MNIFVGFCILLYSNYLLYVQINILLILLIKKKDYLKVEPQLWVQLLSWLLQWPPDIQAQRWVSVYKTINSEFL